MVRMTDMRASEAATRTKPASGKGGAALLRRVLQRIASANGFTLVRTPGLRSVTDLDSPTDALFCPEGVVFEVPLERCRYLYGGSYGPTLGSTPESSGWHPFVALAHQLAEQPDLRYQDSVLARFYERFQPRNQVEFFFPADVVAEHTHSRLAELTFADGRLPVLPWHDGVTHGKGEHGLGPEHGHQSFGPVTEAKGTLEFERVRDTFVSIRDRGYRPELASGEVLGLFVLKGDDYRFLVRGGHHRLAAMAALGHTSVRVAFDRNMARSVNVEALELWPLVRAGVYDATLARLFVEQLFAPDQQWRGRELGLA